MVRIVLASLDTNIEVLCEIHLAIPQILLTENIFVFRRLSICTKAVNTPLYYKILFELFDLLRRYAA
jgi:hypothetical protein